MEESKRFGLPLDERDREAGFHARSPHSQILRYLATAEIESESRVRWGLLTDGRVWRLYDYRARPRASGYYEADLEDLLAPGREEDLRVFQLKTGATVRSLIAVPSQSEGTDRLSATTTIRHFATR